MVDTPPDLEMLAAVERDGDPVDALMAIVRRRVAEGQSVRAVIESLRTVRDEDPMPVDEVIDMLQSDLG